MISFHLVMLLLVLGGLLTIWRLRVRHRAVPVLFTSGSILVLGSCGVLASSVGSFRTIQLLAWIAFLYFPLLLAGVAFLFWRRKPLLALGSAILVLCVCLIGIDAFLIEPRWLELTRVTIPSDKLQVPMRVAVIADLQTDDPGQYEERALGLIMAEQPDLIVLAGDYLQVTEPAEYLRAARTLNALMQQVGLDAPLGIYAVKGNVDWQDWPGIFTGLPVTTFETTSALDLGPVTLTGLTLEDSFNTTLTVDTEQKFHIVLGHSPNFALGQVGADLLIAGHTHGGQVQIPLIGPVLTLSAVPRSWASGVTQIAPGKTLVVSRGVGMERGHAPRMRFLCRPELVILNLEPLDKQIIPAVSDD
jgi:predicted MPP superfamily phosphohydrolase